MDEQEIFRRGIAASLAEDGDLEVVYHAEAGTPPVPVDVAVVSVRAASTEQFDCPLVVCAGAADAPTWTRRSDPGVLCVLSRSALTGEELIAAVRAAAIGLHVNRAAEGGEVTVELDSRRIEILRLLSEGADTREISRALRYSERTVKGLIQDIERRLAAQTRAQAVAEGIRRGLI